MCGVRCALSMQEVSAKKKNNPFQRLQRSYKNLQTDLGVECSYPKNKINRYWMCLTFDTHVTWDRNLEIGSSLSLFHSILFEMNLLRKHGTMMASSAQEHCNTVSVCVCAFVHYHATMVLVWRRLCGIKKATAPSFLTNDQCIIRLQF